MNHIDSLVSYFSPEAGVRRARYRQTLEDSRRSLDRQKRSDSFRRAAEALGYESAKSGRRMDGWFRPATSANAETAMAIRVLRDGARDAVRNNPLAAKGMLEFESKAVGTGIRPQANTGNEAANKTLDDGFEQWAKQTKYWAKQRTAARCIVESGEGLLRHRNRFPGSGTTITVNKRAVEIPYRMQLLEPDFLDMGKEGQTDTGYMIQGVDFNKIGDRRGYWLFAAHPGDTVNTGWFNRGSWQSAFVPASEVEHGYREDRAEQVRGVSWLAPILATLWDLDGYEDAERVRKRGEACLMAFVTRPPADESTTGTITGTATTETDGKLTEEMAPGMVTYVPEGSEVTLAQPHANGGHVEYTTSQQRLVAAGWGILFELLTGNLSEVSYSSYRSGAISFKDLIEAFQWITLIPFVCEPVYARYFEAMKIAGAIPESTPYGVEWNPPAFDLLDRGAEAEADERMVRIGAMTWDQMVQRQGYDSKKQYAAIKEFQQRCRDDKVVLDCDPSQTTRGGMVQQIAGPALTKKPN
jgi:lambda family phage portal protein